MALYKYWKRFPPAHVTLALIAGIEDNSRNENEFEQQLLGGLDAMPYSSLPADVQSFINEYK